MFRAEFSNRLFLVVLFLLLMSSSLLATAVLDKSFGTDGKAPLGFPVSNAGMKILIQPDNKVLVLGTGNSAAYIGRYTENGSFDNAFSGGSARSLWAGFVNGIKLQPDNKILVSGKARLSPVPNADYNSIICRLNSDGSSDTTFGTGGCLTVNRFVGASDFSEQASDIAVLNDGKILAIITTTTTELLRLNSNGTPDTAFGANGYLNLGFSGISLTSVANGKFLFAGSSGITRINGDGIVDTTFGSNGRTIDGGVNQIVLQPDGRILAAGGQTQRFTADGQPDSSFPAGRNSLRIDVLPNGRIIILDKESLFQNRPVLYLLSGQNALLGRERADFNNDEFYDVKVTGNGKFYTVGNNTTLNRYTNFTSLANPQADFDGDDKNDISVYRPSTGYFYFLKSRVGLQSYFSNVPVGTLIPEDFGGNSLNDIVWWTPSGQYSCYQGLYQGVEFGEQPCFVWGLPNDTPVGGDYDGDNRADFAVFRQGVWHIRQSSSGAPIYFQWGAAGDKPVPGDYDFDGKTDVAVYRPSTGVWWVLRSSDGGYSGFQFGASEDKPVPADYDGDGRADYAVFRPSNGYWYLFQSTSGFSATPFGYGTDKPVPGDFDGDGRTDIAVFRPSNGVWYILQSTEGFKGVQLGENSDIPFTTLYSAN